MAFLNFKPKNILRNVGLADSIRTDYFTAFFIGLVVLSLAVILKAKILTPMHIMAIGLITVGEIIALVVMVSRFGFKKFFLRKPNFISIVIFFITGFLYVFSLVKSFKLTGSLVMFSESLLTAGWETLTFSLTVPFIIISIALLFIRKRNIKHLNVFAVILSTIIYTLLHSIRYGWNFQILFFLFIFAIIFNNIGYFLNPSLAIGLHLFNNIEVLV